MSSYDKWAGSLRRASLAGQAVDAIREGIASGAWRDHLPGERRLCEAFQVSRPTISTALHQLAREGLIRIEIGRNPRILRAPRPARKDSAARSVAIIIHHEIPNMDLALYHGLSEVRLRLAKQDFASTFYVCPPASARVQARRIDAFVRQHHPSFCVLWSPNLEMQRWFAARTVPCLILGTCMAGISLPSLDVDQRAVSRHAVGHLLGKGHRRIALILPAFLGGGCIETERGFMEAARPLAGRAGARATVIRHNDTASDLGAKLDGLFDGPNFPTALLVARSEHVFFVLHYLMKRGISVPGQVSIISRDFDPLFVRLNPAISHYSGDSALLNRRLTRMILQLAACRALPPSQSLVFPRFYAGHTVSEPPATGDKTLPA